VARTLRLAFALGLTWGLLPVLLGRHWLGLDLLRMDMGSMCEWRNLWRAGESLWIAPHLGLGVPFAADPLQGVFYLPKWLYFWLPGYLATDFHVALHFGLACSGGALLARTFGLRRRNALLVGVALLFSGTLIDLAKHSPYLIGGAWLPWVWALARLSLRRSTWSRSLGLVLSLGLMLLGGDAFTWLWGFSITLLESLSAATASPRKRLNFMFRVSLLAVLGGAVGLLVWLPGWFELAASGRQDGISLESALRWSWSLRDLPAVILPGIFRRGVLLGGSLWNFFHPNEAGFAWNESPYLGLSGVIGVIGCILLWLRQRDFRARVGWVVPLVGLLAFLLALGSHFPLAGAVYSNFPFLTNLRYPSKHWVALNLSALLLAGVFYSSWVSQKTKRIQNYRILISSLFLIICFALILSRDYWELRSRALALSQGWTWSEAAPNAFSVLLWSLMPLFFSSLVSWLKRSTWNVWVLIPWVLELAVAAPYSYEWMSRTQSNLSLFSPLKTLADEYREKKQANAVFCMSNEIERLGLTQRTLDGAEDLASLMLYQRLMAMPQLNACDGVTVAHGYSVIRQDIQRKLQINFDQLPSAMRAMGCTHFVTLTQDQSSASDEEELLPGVFLEGGKRLIATPVIDPIPDYFVVDRAHPITSDWDYIGLSRAEMRSQDLLSHVLGIGESVVFTQSGVVQGERGGASYYRLKWLSKGSKAKGPIVLGVKTSFARGWKAFQSGRPLRTVAAAGIFLAAWVDDPTQGDVEFRYAW